jgi:hypothetical protein
MRVNYSSHEDTRNCKTHQQSSYTKEKENQILSIQKSTKSQRYTTKKGVKNKGYIKQTGKILK